MFERCRRSEKALVGAMVEIYGQGVSTRKAKATTEELCDHEVLAETADLAAWRKKWGARYPKLYDWVELNIGETPSFCRLLRQRHKNLNSTNMLERLSEVIQRRTLVVEILRSEA